MKNYLAKHYKHYYVQTADGQSYETTRAECFRQDESITADNPNKQRWFYDAENYSYIIRLPRNEQGEALYRLNAANAKSEERNQALKYACVFKDKSQDTGYCDNDCDNCQRKRYPRTIELDKPFANDGENDGEPQYFDIAAGSDEYAEIEEREETDALLAAVAQLSEKQQQLVRLYYFEEKTLREISAVMNIHFSCVQRQLETVHNKLEKLLGKYFLRKNF